MPGTELERDEGIRPGSTVEKLAALRPAFRPDGRTVTAGNASQLSDGAAALLVGDQGAADATGLAPLARIAARAVHAVEPRLYGIGPVQAAELACGGRGSAGTTWPSSS